MLDSLLYLLLLLEEEEKGVKSHPREPTRRRVCNERGQFKCLIQDKRTTTRESFFIFI